MIVVDIGCHPQGSEFSVEKLADAFKPTILYGFDPYPDLQPGIEFWRHDLWRRRTRGRRQSVPPTIVIRSRLAAWTHDGFVSYRVADICSGVVPEGYSAAAVPCFDLVAWLKTLPMPEEEVILKLDCEGCEYPVLWAVYDNALDLMLSKVLVEYHPEHAANGWFRHDRAPLRCEVEDWDANW